MDQTLLAPSYYYYNPELKPNFMCGVLMSDLHNYMLIKPKVNVNNIIKFNCFSDSKFIECIECQGHSEVYPLTFFDGYIERKHVKTNYKRTHKVLNCKSI